MIRILRTILRTPFRTILAAPFFIVGTAYGLAIDFFDAGVEFSRRLIEPSRR